MKPDDIVRIVTSPGPSPVFEFPSDFGLGYEDVEFHAADGVALRGWLIPGGTDRVIVQTHFGGISSRAGYTPEPLGDKAPWPTPIHFLRHIVALHGAGYTVFAYDLRSHGESDRDPTGKLTNGVYESLDVIAAVEFVLNDPRYTDAHLGLLSMCMGANSTTYAFGSDVGLSGNPAIDALILVQPMNVMSQLRASGVTDDELIDQASRLNQEQGGPDLHSSFLPAVPSIHVPTLLVQNTNDPMLDKIAIDSFFDALTVPKEMLWPELEPARLAAYDMFANDPTTMLRFFNAHITQAGQISH